MQGSLSGVSIKTTYFLAALEKKPPKVTAHRWYPAAAYRSPLSPQHWNPRFWIESAGMRQPGDWRRKRSLSNFYRHLERCRNANQCGYKTHILLPCVPRCSSQVASRRKQCTVILRFPDLPIEWAELNCGNRDFCTIEMLKKGPSCTTQGEQIEDTDNRSKPAKLSNPKESSLSKKLRRCIIRLLTYLVEHVFTTIYICVYTIYPLVSHFFRLSSIFLNTR